MRKFEVLDTDGIKVITEEYIFRNYFPVWCNKMWDRGLQKNISFNTCLEDWMVINWAEEIKDES